MTCDADAMPDPSTTVTRLPERQTTSRDELDIVLRSTPLATVAFVRDGHPVALPIGFAVLGDELVIHGSTGSPWLRSLAAGAPASVSITALDAVVVARCGFESSFWYRSAVIFGSFHAVADRDRNRYLQELTDCFIPGRVAELRASNSRELAATLVLSLPIQQDNWSVKVAHEWPEDSEDDVASGGWAGVVPITTTYGAPRRAPDCDPAIPIPPSVQSMTATCRNASAE